MILPEKKTDYKNTVIAVVFTLVIAVSGYALMLYMSAPEHRSNRDIYREITMTNVTDIPRIQPDIPEIEPEAEETQAGESQPETRAPTPEPNQTPRRVELDRSLANQTESQPTPTRPTRTRGNDQTERSRLELNPSDRGREGGFNSLSGESSSLNTGSTRMRGSDGEERSGLEMESGSGASGNGRPSLSGSNAFQPHTGRSDDSNGAPEVGLQELQAYGSNYSDLDEILAGLLEWMRNNPADLPRPVQRLMAEGRWDPQYITSRVSINIEGTDYDILLMLKEELYEVHILLVQGEQATYLIDRNFQKESNSLRVGGAQQHDGTIITINSQMEAASDRKAREFYQIFLTWWESVQHEVNQ